MTAEEEYEAAVARDDPEVHCTVAGCGRVSWEAWRTGFCAHHYPPNDRMSVTL